MTEKTVSPAECGPLTYEVVDTNNNPHALLTFDDQNLMRLVPIDIGAVQIYSFKIKITDAGG